MRTQERSLWVCLLLLIVSGTAKAHLHMIRLIILAALGLAGMYMLHQLAQDFNRIRNPPKPKLLRFLFKRSLSDEKIDHLADLNATSPTNQTAKFKLNFTSNLKLFTLNKVLSNDPLGCAQKYVCHISTLSKKTNKQKNVLDLLMWLRWTDKGGQWEKAIKLGSDQNCDSEYFKCVFTGVQLEAIMAFF